MKLSQLLPKGIKLQIKLFLRFLGDLPENSNFARDAGRQSLSLKPSGVSVNQDIKQSHLFENKVQNLKLGSTEVEKILIKPNQIFSYWKVLGKPTTKKGYRKGRNLIKGKLSEDIGGGLCQLSGIIYHTSLLAGLEILERYCHTLDIYEDHERYTPLGADATVVYGYKDLRIRNNHDFPIQFQFQVNDSSITCEILSEKEIQPKELTFHVESNGQSKSVKTFYETSNKEVAESYYLVP